MLDLAGDFILKKRFGQRGKRAFSNWNDVKSICIVANKNEFFNAKTVEDVFKKTPGSLDLILFHPDKMSSSDCAVSINKKDLGFMSIPKEEIATKIRSKEYDILLDCNKSGTRISKAISMCVRARCKVGHSGLFYSELFDLRLEIKEPVKLNDYLQQALNYLMMIKTNN